MGVQDRDWQPEAEKLLLLQKLADTVLLEEDTREALAGAEALADRES